MMRKSIIGTKRFAGRGQTRGIFTLWLWVFLKIMFLMSCGRATDNSGPVAIYHRDSGALTPFPSNRFSVPADTETGIRPKILEYIPSDDLVLTIYKDMAAEIERLDGFGTSSPIIITFSKEIDVDNLPGTIDEFGVQVNESTDSDSPVGIVDAMTMERIPFFWRYDYQSHLLAIYPSNSLKPKRDYIYYVTNHLTDIFGNSFGPDQRFLALIKSGDFTVMGKTHGIQVLEDARSVAKEIEGKPILVDRFTTQSIFEETIVLLDSVIANYSEPIYDITDTMRGEEFPNVEAIYEATWAEYDYRDEDGRLDVNARRPYHEDAWPFYISLPKSGSQPYPTIMIQHGLGDSREVLFSLVDQFSSFGFATVAIDVSGHGDRIPEHIGESDSFGRISDMLGFSVSSDKFDFQLHKARDLLRQSVIDQMEIRQAFRNTDPVVLDFDNDGTTDLELGQWFYYGQSMGAVIGVMTVAQSADIPVAVLNVGGARLADFLFYHQLFTGTWPFLKAHLQNWGNVLRWSGMMQAILERGDPANYAEMLQLERLKNAPERDILMQFALNDEVVPNDMNWQLARDAHLPLLLPSPIIPDQQSITMELGAEGISGNLRNRTGGFVIFDRITTRSGEVVTANHGNTFASMEATKQAACLFLTYIANDIATIVSTECD